jgi:enolase
MNIIKINHIKGREILDSRGRPTIEVEISIKNPHCEKYDIKATGISPSGASCGKFEAYELRDNDSKRFHGFGVLNAVKNINKNIKDLLFAESDKITDQFYIDEKLIKLDNTENKSNLGANALIATSMAIAKLNALIFDMPLFKHLNNLLNYKYSENCKALNTKEDLKIRPNIPNPLVNILNGGLHADNNLAIQEFMIIPYGIQGFKEKIRACSEVFWSLKKILKKNNFNTNIGDEGGFAPNFSKNEMALEYLEKSIIESGYKLGSDFVFGLDVAASSFFDEKNKTYFIDNKEISEDQMIEYLISLSKKFPIFSVEDPLNEESYDAWKNLGKKFINENNFLNKKIKIVGDDIFVTNKKLFQYGIDNKIGNTILIKPNQIGTVSETLDVISLAIQNKYDYIISHRSGETEDIFISHLAFASSAFGIKAGSVCRSERTAKYNELIRIEEEFV